MEIVDLSVAFSEGMPRFSAPWFPEFSITEVRPERPDHRRFTSLQLSAHNGTHVESSNHLTGNDATIDTLELGRFAGLPTIVDLRDVPDGTEISVDTVRSRLDGHGATRGQIVLLMTSYNDRCWAQESYWESSPWLSVRAAEYIASAKPALVGLDFQTERPRDGDFAVHRALLGSEIALCEYLFNLDRLDEETLFLALPMKIVGTEAAPVRAVGIKGLPRTS
jgi:arylformamidase